MASVRPDSRHFADTYGRFAGYTEIVHGGTSAPSGNLEVAADPQGSAGHGYSVTFVILTT
jgi:hypothetical protein